MTHLRKWVTQDKSKFEKNGVKDQVNIFVLIKRKSIVNMRRGNTLRMRIPRKHAGTVLKMAESCVAEPLPCFEDAEQLIADEYFNHASDSMHEDVAVEMKIVVGKLQLLEQLENRSWTHAKWI